MEEVSRRRPLEGWERVVPVASNPHSSPPTLPPPPGSGHNLDKLTYVVQMPKDQIYRVPPPENNELVERLRQNPAQKRYGNGRCCLWTCLIILAISLLLVSTFVIVVFVVFRPVAPSLSVSNLLIKNSKQFGISLTVKNPNKGLEMDYEKDGEASLIFKDKHVAGGKTPDLIQSRDASAEFKLVVKALNSTYPEEMENSMNDKKSEIPVLLKLNIKLGVKCKLSKIKIWKSELEVDCKFKVSSLKKGSKILSESCDSKMEFS